MKILRVLGKLDRGGAETGFVRLLQEIDRSKYQTDVLVHTREPGAYDDLVRSLGARIIPCLAISNPIVYLRNFSRVLREFGPYDVVHSSVHLYSGWILAGASANAVPVRIVHAHTSSNTCTRSPHCGRAIYIRVMRKAIELFSNAGLAVSEEAAESLFPSDWRARRQWRVLHSGLDLAPFTSDVDRSRLRAELGLSSASVVIGHVGRFDTAKNQAFIVSIAAEFLKKVPGAMFLLVGDGSKRREVEDLVRELGLAQRFTFAGVRRDVPALMMGAMDALLFPSKFEGLPTTLLEAQAAGLPCLISDVISKECEVIPGLIDRLSLSDPAGTWVQHLLLAVYGRRPAAREACAQMSGWSSHLSATLLTNFYDECLSASSTLA